MGPHQKVCGESSSCSAMCKTVLSQVRVHTPPHCYGRLKQQLRLVCTFFPLNPATLAPKAKILHPPFLHLSISLTSLLSTSKKHFVLLPSSAPLAVFHPVLIALPLFHDAECECWLDLAVCPFCQGSETPLRWCSGSFAPWNSRNGGEGIQRQGAWSLPQSSRAEPTLSCRQD